MCAAKRLPVGCPKGSLKGSPKGSPKVSLAAESNSYPSIHSSFAMRELVPELHDEHNTRARWHPGNTKRGGALRAPDAVRWEVSSCGQTRRGLAHRESPKSDASANDTLLCDDMEALPKEEWFCDEAGFREQLHS